MNNNEIRLESQELNQQAVMLIKANSLDAAKAEREINNPNHIKIEVQDKNGKWVKTK